MPLVTLQSLYINTTYINTLHTLTLYSAYLSTDVLGPRSKRLPLQQQLRALLEDELDRTTIVRLLKSVAFFQGTISEPLQHALAEHIQVTPLGDAASSGAACVYEVLNHSRRPHPAPHTTHHTP